MREIKFRVWDNNHEAMHYSDDAGSLDWIFGLVDRHGGAIMQYTGLKDKNQKYIYEGDILRWQDWQQEECEDWDRYIVSFKAPSFVWGCFRDGKKLDTNGEVLRDTEDFEIMGNIYENKGLLK